MQEVAKFIIEGKEIELPVIIGSEGEKAIDIASLRNRTGYITLDLGYSNTGSCKSAISYIDGEKGILRYRGINIEELAKYSSFVEVAYLLIKGDLPTRTQLNEFSVKLNDQSIVHEDLKDFFKNFPPRTNPMQILSSMVNALRSFYPYIGTEEEIDSTVTRLISKIRTMAAMSYKISRGHTVVYPRSDLTYCANFLNMMFDAPIKPYKISEEQVKALNTFWITHADHGQSCSTTAVRMVGSGKVNVYAAISAGIAALAGSMHGGINQKVIENLETIKKEKIKISDFIENAKKSREALIIPGFGHAIYKTYDPRAKILKETCQELFQDKNLDRSLFDIALQIEDEALKDSYFIDNKLYPNMHFYSGLVLRALEIPTNMFTVMFAIGRLPGWIAQWKEDADDSKSKLYRPRQIYTGPQKTDYVPILERK